MLLHYVTSMLIGLGLIVSMQLFAADVNYGPSGGGAWTPGTNHYTKNCGYFTNVRFSDDEDDDNIYILTVGPPSTWSFIPSKTTVTGGIKNGDYTASSSSAKKITSANTNPVSFTITLSGQLTKPGPGTGTVTWSASASADFYYINPLQIIHGYYGNFYINSKKNGTIVASNWSMSGETTLTNKNGVGIGSAGDWDPAPDTYTINAALYSDTNRTTSASLKVVEVVFEESGNYGFDDYTDENFPYQSMKAGENSTIDVDITPSANVTLSVTGITLSPTTVSGGGGDVTVTSASATNWVTINAEPTDANGSDFAGQMYIRAYTATTRSIAFVRVNSPGAYSQNLNTIFKQAVVSFSTPAVSSVNTVPAKTPANNEWTDTLLDYLPADHTPAGNYDHVVFILKGTYASNSSVLGEGQEPGTYSWIFVDASPNGNTISHEVGHNLGIGHAPGADIYNLMLSTNASTKLRSGQWDTIRSNL